MKMTKRSKRTRINAKLKDLEEIVKRFEEGKIDIEEAVKEYKKAAKMIVAIKKELSELDLEIEEIKDSYQE